MATLVTRCCRKTNQLQSVQSMENKEHIKIFVSHKKKKKVLPWQHLLLGVAEKLQSVQGYGKQRTHKNIYKSKKQTKKVLP